MPYRNDDLDLDATIRRAALVAVVIGSLQLIFGGVFMFLLATADGPVGVLPILSAVAYVGMGAVLLALGLRQRSEATRTSERFTVLMGILGVALGLATTAFVARIVMGEGASGLLGPLVLAGAIYTTRQGRASLRQIEEEAAASRASEPAR